MYGKLLRTVITLTGILLGYALSMIFLTVYNGLDIKPGNFTIPDNVEVYLPFGVALIFGFLFFIITPLIKRRSIVIVKKIESDLQKVPTNDIVIGTIGLILGLIIAYLITQLLAAFGIMSIVGIGISILIYLFMGYLGITLATKRVGKVLSADIANFRKTASFTNIKKIKGNQDAKPKILDTSVIIDGKIADILDTGFVEGVIIIPDFVLEELRHIADSADALKRNRGRRGLDILNKIQNDKGIEIFSSNDKTLAEVAEVDDKLLKLAQIINGKVVTNDFNLNKVATIHGVEVLNINELTKALKPVVLHGEEMRVYVAKEGKENNQGVSYLDDGTMIVIEDGRKMVGQTINIIVTSVLQTAAGKMIFARCK